ncbi:MAG: GspE/PulE family protein [Patescibacteria group bacterium]
MNQTNTKTKDLNEKLFEIRRKEEETRINQIAEKFNIPYINLLIIPIDTKDLAIIPQEKAEAGKMLVIKKSGNVLNIAVNNPDNPETVKTINELKEQGFECKLFAATLTSLKKAWERYESVTREKQSASSKGIFVIQKNELTEFKKSLGTIQELKKVISNLSTTRLLTIILAGSIEMKVSDIHLEPTKEEINMRYRVDGLLQNVANFPQKEYRFLLSRIKTLSDMLLNIHDVSQDGRFTINVLDGEKIEQSIDIRVSILPSTHGESVVMRLLGLSSVKLNLKDLNIRPEFLKIIESQINSPTGMILTTGPTGSGKTTTLYACLNYVNKPGTKIITVEDPVEYRLAGVTQTQISKRKGHTFATTLKSIVRQDPDILMIGEIRDEESAEISVQFALTGHLVFSTFHTNEAAGAIPRLISLKIKPDALASSLNLAIAQRLVRKLCPDCKKEQQPPKETLESIKKILDSIPEKSGLSIPKKLAFYQAQGCAKCHGLGYQGRIGIFELLTVSEEIKKLILKETAAFEIQNKAQEEGMTTLIQDALLRVVEGSTDLEEVKRVIGTIN